MVDKLQFGNHERKATPNAKDKEIAIMVRILIFNNNLEQAQLLCSLIAVYFKKVRHSYNIKAYTNAIEAEKHIRTDAKNDDIVFMDCTNLQKAAALIKRFRERNNAASWVYIGPDLGGLCRIHLRIFLTSLTDGKS